MRANARRISRGACAVALAIAVARAAAAAPAAPPAAAAAPTGAPAPPRVSARAAVLVDAYTGRLLFERNGLRRVAPASTTKILTALVALEQGNLDDVVTVSPRAARLGGSSLGLRAGQQFRLRDLLTGMMLRSGNDAAMAIAEHVGGSVEGFVERMNRRAIEAGAIGTHFVNPHGLDHPDHYTTAYDLALLTRAAMRHPGFASLVARREATVTRLQRPAEWRVHNTNRLLWDYPAADGVKTGTTGQAGNCLVASATRGDQQVIAVVMDAANRWRDAARLLDWAYEHFELVKVAGAGEPLGRAEVAGALGGSVPLRLGEELAAVVPRRIAAGVTTRVEVFGRLRAPVREGQPVGALLAFAGDELVGQAPVVAAATVPATWEAALGWLLAIWRFLLRL